MHTEVDTGIDRHVACWSNTCPCVLVWSQKLSLKLRTAGHEYDVSGVFATNPKDAPGPGNSLNVLG